MTTPTDIEAVIERLEQGEGSDNALDVLVEVLMFDPSDPDEPCMAVRPNAAGTKMIYTYRDGGERAYWADEWTKDRPGVIAALKARIGE